MVSFIRFSPWGRPTVPLGAVRTLTPIMSHVDVREDGERREGEIASWKDVG